MTDKTLEIQLKEEILRQYRSMSEFSRAADIPNSTVATVIERGILHSKMPVVLKIFKTLDLDIESVTTGEIKRKCPIPEEEDVFDFLVAQGIIDVNQTLSFQDIKFIRMQMDNLKSWFAK